MNSCYLEFLNRHNLTDEKTKNSIFRMLLYFSIGSADEKTELTLDQVNELVELWKDNIYEY